MKSIVLFYLLLILTILVSHSCSYASHKNRLYNLLRRSLHTSADSLSLPMQSDQDMSVLTQQPDSIEEQDNLQVRNDWDSGEHYYFQWANKNRRPVEYLTGRKREVERVGMAPRGRRINGGLWRSGLVG